VHSHARVCGLGLISEHPVVVRFEIGIVFSLNRHAAGSMDKAQRAELIRRRFQAVVKLPYVPTGKVKPKTPPIAKPTKICLQWPEANQDTTRGGIWIHESDKKPKLMPQAKRSHGESPLTKIARRWRRIMPRRSG
jgi:hypothetical protein